MLGNATSKVRLGARITSKPQPSTGKIQQPAFSEILPADIASLSKRVAAFLTFFDHKAVRARAVGISPTCRAVLLAVKDDCEMHLSSKLMSQPKLRRGLLILGTIYSLSGAAAHAQNIDQGKSATRLFADSCATCHRSAGGLAKGRFRPTLFLFLQDHYTSSSSAAWELASYLASVDSRQSGRSRAATSHSTTRTPRSAIRPPMPVPSTRSN